MTVTQFSDRDAVQKIAALMQTEPGELPLALHYGIYDPSFRKVKPTEIEAAINTFYPGILVNKVKLGLDNQGGTLVEIFFTNQTGA